MVNTLWRQLVPLSTSLDEDRTTDALTFRHLLYRTLKHLPLTRHESSLSNLEPPSSHYPSFHSFRSLTHLPKRERTLLLSTLFSLFKSPLLVLGLTPVHPKLWQPMCLDLNFWPDRSSIFPSIVVRVPWSAGPSYNPSNSLTGEGRSGRR